MKTITVFCGVVLAASILLAAPVAAVDITVEERILWEPEAYRSALTEEVKRLNAKLSTPKHLKIYEPSVITLYHSPEAPIMMEMLPGYHWYRLNWTEEYVGHESILGIKQETAVAFIVGPQGTVFRNFDLSSKHNDILKIVQAERINAGTETDARRLWALIQSLGGTRSWLEKYSPSQHRLPNGNWVFLTGCIDNDGTFEKPHNYEEAYRVVLKKDGTVSAIQEMRSNDPNRGKIPDANNVGATRP